MLIITLFTLSAFLAPFAKVLFFCPEALPARYRSFALAYLQALCVLCFFVCSFLCTYKHNFSMNLLRTGYEEVFRL